MSRVLLLQHLLLMLLQTIALNGNLKEITKRYPTICVCVSEWFFFLYFNFLKSSWFQFLKEYNATTNNNVLYKKKSYKRRVIFYKTLYIPLYACMCCICASVSSILLFYFNNYNYNNNANKKKKLNRKFSNNTYFFCFEIYYKNYTKQRVE